jgi:hypothetical protein
MQYLLNSRVQLEDVELQAAQRQGAHRSLPYNSLGSMSKCLDMPVMAVLARSERLRPACLSPEWMGLYAVGVGKLKEKAPAIKHRGPGGYV